MAVFLCFYWLLLEKRLQSVLFKLVSLVLQKDRCIFLKGAKAYIFCSSIGEADAVTATVALVDSVLEGEGRRNRTFSGDAMVGKVHVGVWCYQETLLFALVVRRAIDGRLYGECIRGTVAYGAAGF